MSTIMKATEEYSASPTVFVQNLLQHSPNDPGILSYLYDQSYSGQICILDDKDSKRKYTLQITLDALCHGPEGQDSPGNCHLNLTRTSHDGEDGSPKLFIAHNHPQKHFLTPEDQGSDKSELLNATSHASYSASPTASTRAVFVPLGYLVEHKTDTPKAKRTTNYVVLWNVSTNPMSLWLVYDYWFLDTDNEMHWNKLGDEYYHNRLFWDVEGEFPRDDSLNNTNQESQHLSVNHSVSNISKTHPYTYIDENGFSSKPPAPDPTIDSREDSKHIYGFLGIDPPFDFAMLAPDIEKWDASMGLDLAVVKMSLANSYTEIGDTLRAECAIDLMISE